MKTKLQELWGRIKTLVWGVFWVALTFFVDNFSQVFMGISLPEIHLNLAGASMTINTSILVGLLINQISKYIHNMNAGKVE